MPFLSSGPDRGPLPPIWFFIVPQTEKFLQNSSFSPSITYKE